MNDPTSMELLDWVRSRCFGKYRGTCVGHEGSADRGRIKVKVPAVLGNEEVWAMPCVPYAGPQVGFYSLPEVGAGVWVEFEGGDPSFPIWVGCFWANGELPEDGGATVKAWRTKSSLVRADDERSSLAFESASGGNVEITDTVVVNDGAFEVT